MKGKPIRVDWDALEAAFENSSEDAPYYLDRVTGHVLVEGEGEEAAFEDGDESDYAPPPEVPAPMDRTRLPITPVSTERKVEWMREFVHEVEDLDAEAVAELREALREDDPAPTLIEILRRRPESRERWYLYRSERLHGMIEAWLDEHGVARIDPPPWAG